MVLHMPGDESSAIARILADISGKCYYCEHFDGGGCSNAMHGSYSEPCNVWSPPKVWCIDMNGLTDYSKNLLNAKPTQPAPTADEVLARAEANRVEFSEDDNYMEPVPGYGEYYRAEDVQDIIAALNDAQGEVEERQYKLEEMTAKYHTRTRESQGQYELERKLRAENTRLAEELTQRLGEAIQATKAARSTRDTLRAEEQNEMWQRHFIESQTICCQERNRATKAEARVEKLVNYISERGHSYNCAKVECGADFNCTCELDAALAECEEAP